MNNHYSNIEMDTIQVRLYSELHRLQDELDIKLNELRLIAQRMARKPTYGANLNYDPK